MDTLYDIGDAINDFWNTPSEGSSCMAGATCGSVYIWQVRGVDGSNGYDNYGDDGSDERGGGGKPGGRRTRPDGSNKQVDDAGRAEGLADEELWDFRRYVEDIKQEEGRQGSDNYSYKDLRNLARQWKDGSR